MMEVSPFGVTSDGRQVDQITLDNGILRCCILTYGATLTNLFVPGRDGQPVDVVLGFDQVQTYQEQDKYLGAVVAATPTASQRAGSPSTVRSTPWPATTGKTTSTAAPPASPPRSGRPSPVRTGSPLLTRARTWRRASPAASPPR